VKVFQHQKMTSPNAVIVSVGATLQNHHIRGRPPRELVNDESRRLTAPPSAGHTALEQQDRSSKKLQAKYSRSHSRFSLEKSINEESLRWE